MRIRHFNNTDMFEGLHRGEFYVWNVHFTDGTSQPVRITWDETSPEMLEKKFGKPVDHIDYDFSIQSGAGHDAPAAKTYHDQQDKRDAAAPKSAWQTAQPFTEKFAEPSIYEIYDLRTNKRVHQFKANDDVHAELVGDDYLESLGMWPATEKYGIRKVRSATTTEGSSSSGINRCAPATDVSYEKVLSDVTDEWRGQKVTVNELSVKSLRNYTAKVQQMDPAADKFKTVKHAEGYAKANHKIATMTGHRSHKMYESKLQEFIAETDFADIANAQHAETQPAKKQPVKEIPFHGWTIRYRPAGDTHDKVKWQVMDKKGDIKHSAESGTDKDAVRDAEEWIKQSGSSQKAITSNVTIDFNAPFTRQFASDGAPFYATIEPNGNHPMLVLSSKPQSGMKTSHFRPVKNGTGSPVVTLSAKEANAAKLQPNGRYVLGSKEQIDDESMMFPLIFQSITQSSTDKMRMSEPGLTVAAMRDVDEAMDPWHGYTPDDKKANALKKAPKSSMTGSQQYPFDQMVKDTIKQHGLKWAFDYYVRKNGLPPRHFKIYAGL